MDCVSCGKFSPYNFLENGKWFCSMYCMLTSMVSDHEENTLESPVYTAWKVEGSQEITNSIRKIVDLNRIIQLGITPDGAKAREIRIGECFGDITQLLVEDWICLIFRRKVKPHHSWKYIMHELIREIGSMEGIYSTSCYKMSNVPLKEIK